MLVHQHLQNGISQSFLLQSRYQSVKLAILMYKMGVTLVNIHLMITCYVTKKWVPLRYPLKNKRMIIMKNNGVIARVSLTPSLLYRIPRPL